MLYFSQQLYVRVNQDVSIQLPKTAAKK